MKRYLLIFNLLLATVSSWGQDLGKDFVVIDSSAPSLEQLKSQYSGKANALINESAKPAPYVIALSLNGKQLTDLHLFVATQPGSLNFNSVKISVENAGGFKQYFSDWKAHVSGKVIVHSTDVFTNAEGKALESKLEELSGLDFTTL